MTEKVVIIDYGAGNLLNVVRAFEHCDAEVSIAESANAILGAERLVLPGVGAFSDSMRELKNREMIEPILAYAASGKPLLGICLGMQLLLDSSEEFGNWDGLGLIPGNVVGIPETGIDGAPHKIPHIGWNELTSGKCESWGKTVLDSIPEGSTVYFVHSFMAVPTNDQHRLADCDYDGRQVCAAVQRENIIGCQFHPEKSGPVGLQIIQNFLSF
ncbi:MAG: imidazole glycerol phosphate synthase subunit HisH [Planctomycetota bacterium]|jgi:imidazole glycerol-phosphate synthase subunit HisH|uniref:imidazole glycerol phosphate synthase subunit HisH n=1 Tax=uncultured Gimesia sp. TaxID=1678688 RepID=UPI002615CA47|nr:imidazole glycerol phosphate synthase subunit HisH [uncultured Gimesia sp.]